MIGWCDATWSRSRWQNWLGPVLSLHMRSSTKKATDDTDVYGQDLPKADPVLDGSDSLNGYCNTYFMIRRLILKRRWPPHSICRDLCCVAQVHCKLEAIILIYYDIFKSQINKYLTKIKLHNKIRLLFGLFVYIRKQPSQCCLSTSVLRLGFFREYILSNDPSDLEWKFKS